MIGVILSLMSAASWGTGDFLGGVASRKLNQFQVLLITTSSSLILLLVCMFIWRERLPTIENLGIAMLAGICGALGLAALYRGLSIGSAALVAPVAGVIGAVVPTIVGIIRDGLPNIITLIGFLFALIGIWLVASVKDDKGNYDRAGLGLAILAGIGFGGFLALIALVENDQIFAPLVFAKIASLLLSGVLLKYQDLPIPMLAESPTAIWSGIFDAGGNILYLFATQFTRLDIAAILSSLYPAGTVILSNLVLKEKFSGYQWIGVCSCLAAIMLITIK